MGPDRTNYESWLIDYLDGNLDNSRRDLLVTFLDENPDLKEELDDIASFNLIAVPETFKNKESLRKTVKDLNESQFEHLCISSIENELSDLQRAELEAIVAGDSARKNTLLLFEKTRLFAPDIKFKNKSSVKRFTLSQKIVRLSALGLSAAAGAALIFSIFNTVPDKTERKNSLTPEIAVIEANKTAPSNTADTRKPSKTIISQTLPQTHLSSTEAIPLIQPPVTEEFEHINISKVDFKKEVQLYQYIPLSLLSTIVPPELKTVVKYQKPQLNERIANYFRNKILRKNTPESGILKGYEIADAGILGLNKLLGWQMSLQETRDEKGELKSLYFNSRILKFNAPFKKEQLGP